MSWRTKRYAYLENTNRLGEKRKGKGKGTKSHTSAHADTNHYVGREAAACEVGANIVDQRVAANCNIFLNMIHEGLVYLGAIQQGQIVLNNADSPVITLRSSPKAIATMFYGNDVLVFFSCDSVQCPPHTGDHACV